MRLKGFKRTIAAVMALVIVGGAMPAIPGGLIPVKPMTASAAPEQEGSAVLENGVLTLSGYVTYSMLAPYFHNEEVTSVYALEGTVFSGNCSHMFANRVVDYDLIKGTDRYLNLKSIDLHNVDTSGVTDMMGMFYGLPALESLNVSGWDTSNVTSMYSMFCECDKLTSIDVSSFDTSKVSRMPYMFLGCKSLTSLDLSNFDTSNVDNMCMMFEDCTSLRTLDISSFSSNSNPWTMAMFRNCSSLKTIYASAGFSSEPGNSEMFKGCSSLVGGNLTRCDGVNNITEQYARIDKSNAPGFFTDKFCTFDEATGTLTLTGYVSKNEMDVNYIHNPEMNAKIKHIVAEDTAVLPAGCQNLFGQLAALETVDFSRIDSSAVTSINGMFYKCKNLRSIDLTGFDTSSIVDMRYAFNNCTKLEKIYVNKKWNVSGTEDEGVYSSGMFYNCTSLVGGNGTTYNSAYTDNTYARADEGTARPGYLTLVDDNYIVNGTLYVKNFNTVDYSDYAEIKKIVALEGAEITSNGVGLFNANSKSKLKTVTEIDLSNASISNNLKYLNSMFSGCSNLKTVKFPTGCKASNVEQVGNMFNGCSSLRNVDLGFFDTAKLTYTGYMFSGCSSLKSIDLSGINTENVTNMAYMFSGCSSLESIDLGGFDTSKVNNMDSMFSYCSGLNELDLRNFDTGNVTYMARMFRGCTSLETILAGDKWSTDQITASSAHSDMFTGCTSLVGGNGTVFSADHTDKEYARIDSDDAPGYLTKPCCSYAPETYTLTLSGEIDKDELSEYRRELPHNAHAINIVADETAVLPEDCSDMFGGFLYNQYIDLSKADASRVKIVRGMFDNSRRTETIKLPANLVTSAVTDTSYMFRDCYSLKNVDLTGFDTSNVTEMSEMFSECSALTSLDVSGFDTSKVTDMSHMFRKCSALSELDLSRFDTSSVTDMSGMFYNDKYLGTIYASSKFSVGTECFTSDMFSDCYNLVGGKGTKFSSQHFDGEYARVDKPNEPGYFTSKSTVEIISQPADKRAAVGSNVFFAVVAAGKDLTYQWQYDSGSGWKNSNLTGSKTPVLSVKATEARNGLKYRCIVSDAIDSLASDEAVLTVEIPVVLEEYYKFGDTMKFGTGAFCIMDEEFPAESLIELEGDNKLTYEGYNSRFGQYGLKIGGNECWLFGEDRGTPWGISVKSGNGTESSPFEFAIQYTSPVSAPVITSQPVDKSGTVGSTVKFTVAATGSGLTYQWQYDNGSGWKNSGLTGAKTTELSVPVTEARNGIKYRCVIKDANDETVNSNEVTLKVTTKITKQPADYSGAIGDTAKFTVAATGAGLTYQWQYDNGAGWKNSGVTGAKTTELSVPVTEARNGIKYRCVIKDANGTELISGTAVLKVTTKITKQPVDYSGAIGDTAKFTVAATGAGLTYQWQYLKGSDWLNSGLTGAKTATLSVPVTEARNGLKYRCVVKDANGKTVNSNAATLTVNANASAITSQPADASGCVGDTVKFKVTAAGTGLTYQWQYLKGNDWLNSNLTGSKTNTLSVAVTEARNGLKYRCVIKDATGKTINSNAATLKVTSKITKQPVDFGGAVGDTAKFTVTATGVGLTYQWQYLKGNDWLNSGLTGAKTATLSVPVTTARNGLKYRCIIKDANGKTLTTSVVTLTVKK